MLYRPVEQLLSRTIADHDAREVAAPSTCASPRRSSSCWRGCSRWSRWRCSGPIEDDLFAGSSTLYWILVVGVLAYAASYFARGYLAGHHLFPLYGGLVLMEASSRCLFALAVAIGIAEGQSAVALGNGGRADRVARGGAVGAGAKDRPRGDVPARRPSSRTRHAGRRGARRPSPASLSSPSPAGPASRPPCCS